MTIIPDAALDAAYQAYEAARAQASATQGSATRRGSAGPKPVSEMLVDVLTAALPHLLTDEMVERAAEAIAYELVDSDATYWRQIARRTLEAALGD